MLANRGQSGFTLLEVMISLVILSVGLLGVAGMQSTGLRINNAAFNRTIANTLAMDMMDRIRANPQAINAYNNFDTDSNIPGNPGCIKTGCNPTELANHDKFEWSQPLISDNKKILANGRAIIQKNGDNIFITILWQETHFQGIARPDVFSRPECKDDIACLQVNFQI